MRLAGPDGRRVIGTHHHHRPRTLPSRRPLVGGARPPRRHGHPSADRTAAPGGDRERRLRPGRPRSRRRDGRAGAPGTIAAVAADQGARFVHISSDVVFAGTTSRPLAEAEPTAPVTAYGKAKARCARGRGCGITPPGGDRAHQPAVERISPRPAGAAGGRPLGHVLHEPGALPPARRSPGGGRARAGRPPRDHRPAPRRRSRRARPAGLRVPARSHCSVSTPARCGGRSTPAAPDPTRSCSTPRGPVRCWRARCPASKPTPADARRRHGGRISSAGESAQRANQLSGRISSAGESAQRANQLGGRISSAGESARRVGLVADVAHQRLENVLESDHRRAGDPRRCAPTPCAGAGAASSA